jgi:hypothetical protein
MSLYRGLLVAGIGLFAAVFSTGAFAGCGGCGFGYGGPVGYAPAPYYGSQAFGGGCGGCCSGCGATVAVAQPVVVQQPVVVPQPVVVQQPVIVEQPVIAQPAPVMVAATPITVDHWDANGCGGCGASCDSWHPCGPSVGYYTNPSFTPAPAYVVNQGPVYSGPGVMLPNGGVYSPLAGLSDPGAYPYVAGPGYRVGPGYAYGPRYAAYPRHHWYHHHHNYWRG